GQPGRPAHHPLPDLRRPAGLLHALRRPGGPAGARPGGEVHPGARPPVGRHLHRAPDRRAPAGRRRGPRPRPGLPAAGGSGALRRGGGGPGRPGGRRGAARADRLRGPARPRAAGRGGAAGRQRPRPAAGAAGRVRRRRLRGAGRDRRRRVRRAARRAEARQAPPAPARGTDTREGKVSPAVEGSTLVPPQVAAAYRYCEAVTGGQARNFSYGIRLLPEPKRLAMSAIYALARRVDDIGDGDWDDARKAEQLLRTRALLDEIRDGEVDPTDTDPVKVALADAAARFPIPLDAFDELIDGVEMDLRGATYATFEELRTYCRCVAGSIGRLSLGVFGCTEPKRGEECADTLGLALQLTNILRDLREDAANGRTYLPAEDLVRFGCEQGFASAVPAPGADFTGLIAFEAARAQE